MSSPSVNDLRAALAAFMQASATRDASQIGAALNRVGELAAALGPQLPAQLRHYLERRSYQKALEFLSGDSPAKH
jgi:hypothetical protein